MGKRSTAGEFKKFSMRLLMSLFSEILNLAQMVHHSVSGSTCQRGEHTFFIVKPQISNLFSESWGNHFSSAV